MRVRGLHIGMRLLAICFALLLALPAAAQATSLRISSGTLRYSLTAGSVSRMTVTQVPGTIAVHDASTSFTASAPCKSTGPNDATCPDSTVRAISISGAERSDVFDVSAVGYPATISGGGGNDTLIGGLGNDVLSGGAANDTLIGGPGNDRLNGGDGNDRVDGGAGADRMTGGRGRDIVTYQTHSSGVNVSLDGKTNDGSPGEGDSVSSDFEQVNGSPAGDVLTAKTGNRVLLGEAGNDVLTGGTGNDGISGGDGDDRIDGGAGSDNLDGAAGHDTLDYSSRFVGVKVSLAAHTATTLGESDRVFNFEDVLGSRRDDRLTGDGGPNLLSGGGGNDVLDGGLGADVLIGGSGFDMATYAGRGQPLTVSLDGSANDGAGGEGDNVSTSVEGVTGGNAGDHITGNSRANELLGGGGSDVIRAGRGRDTVNGGAGSDTLDGGPGADLLTGGPGRDTVRGGSGGDLLFTRDRSADAALCGSGRDTATVDRRDRVSGCERVRGRRKH